MEPQHPCNLPPVDVRGETWQCPDCGAGWVVEDDGWLFSGPRWERTSWTLPYVD